MPSKTAKQQRFMGAKLGEQRKKGHNSTGMSEQQLREFAGSRVSRETVEKPGRSIVDVEYHEREPRTATLTLSGFLYEPGEMCHDAEKHHEHLASWKDRDVKNTGDYKAPVLFHGPDTSFRVEEVNPQHYGRDYEPAPWKDYFKTIEKAREQGIRLEQDYEYSHVATPGAVAEEANATAYGAIDYNKVPTDEPDNRSFESQLKFSRSQEEFAEGVNSDTKTAEEF